MRFRKYLPLLRDYGVESSVFTGTPKAKKISEDHKKEPWYTVGYGEELPTESYEDIEIVRYRLPEKPRSKRLDVYHQKLRENICTRYKDTDVIQFLSPFSESTLETFRYAKENNIATVAACTLAKKPHPNIVKRIINNYQTKKIFSSCDCVVVSSEEMKEYLCDLGVRNRIEIIANGVDTQAYQPVNNPAEKNAIRKKLGIDSRKKVLLNVGSVHPRKGTELLLGAFQMMSQERDDIELYVAGSRIDMVDNSLKEFHQKINKFISKPSLNGNVHFLGLVDNVNEYMKVADVFLFPSREEGMGNVVMEAMASGLPVVVTPYLGFPSIFGKKDKHYLLADFDEQSIVNSVNQLFDNRLICENMISNAMKNVKDNLSVVRSVGEFSELYSRLNTNN